MDPVKTHKIVLEIFLEREAQAQKWGPQHHPATHEDVNLASETGAKLADEFKVENDKSVEEHGDAGWIGILLEEVYEALAETKPGDEAKLRTELIQVAAVAAAWVEDLDRG